MKCDKSFRLNDSKIIHISFIACDLSCCLFVRVFSVSFSFSLFKFRILLYQTFWPTLTVVISWSKAKKTNSKKNQTVEKQSRGNHFKSAPSFSTPTISFCVETTLYQLISVDLFIFGTARLVWFSAWNFVNVVENSFEFEKLKFRFESFADQLQCILNGKNIEEHMLYC